MDRRAAFDVLRLSVDATAADVRMARRRLAKGLHPDHGGDAERMRELNAATTAALEAIDERDRPAPAISADEPTPSPVPPRGPRWVVEDVPSFVVEGSPAVAFEWLIHVAPALGDVLDDDPPYALEVEMAVPSRCWCRLELLPEAGASTVNLYVGVLGGGAPPTVEAVRDVWVDSLNSTEWPPS
jgi:hypothetical protein